jgi:hypothetical protein
MLSLREFDEFSPWCSPNGLEEELPVLSLADFEAFFPFPFPILISFTECAVLFLLGPFFYMLQFNKGQGQGRGGVNAAHLTSHNATAQAQAHMAQAQALMGR